MAEQAQELAVSVWRSRGEGGRFERFAVPLRESQTVLDVVIWIQHNAAPDLAYRYACRVGMCGSCAMTVNGVPRWTCRTHVSRVAARGRLEIAPLRNLPVVKDLATDMDPFFEKWVAAEAVFHASQSRNDPVAPIAPQSPRRKAADAHIECINCAICYGACDVVAASPDYLGPAALNRAWTLLNDDRDQGRDAILDAVSGLAGCHNCHAMANCAAHCPNGLRPVDAIAGLKRASARRFFGGKHA